MTDPNPNSDRDQGRDLLAGHLGGELSDEERRRFEETLERDGDLAARVAGLRETLELMRSLPAAPPATPKPASPRPWPIGLRYAAAIGLAFIAGYLAGGRPASAPPTVDPPPAADFASAYGVEYVKQSSSSGLARSLLALHAATSADPATDPRPAPVSDTP